LSDCQIQPLDEEGVQLRGILRPEKGFLELLAGADDAVPIDLDHTILAPHLHHNAIHAAIAEDLTDHPSIILEAISGDQWKFRECTPSDRIIQKPLCIGVAASAHDGRDPQPRPDFQGREDPTLPDLALYKCPYLVGL
jgi:hypothetical protein